MELYGVYPIRYFYPWRIAYEKLMICRYTTVSSDLTNINIKFLVIFMMVFDIGYNIIFLFFYYFL
jgi:hypothetical protein